MLGKPVDEAARSDEGEPGAAMPDVETELRDREAQLELALEVAALGTWSWDLRTGNGWIDARGAAIVGLKAGYLADIGEAQRERIHPDDFAQVQADVAAGMAADEPFILRYRVIHADGTLHHVFSRARVLHDDAGTPVRIVGTNRDVTGEFAAEEQLRERDERYRLLFESIDSGFAVVELIGEPDAPEPELLVLEMNPVLERLTGMRAGDDAILLARPNAASTSWLVACVEAVRTGKEARFEDATSVPGRRLDVFSFPYATQRRRAAVLVSDITDRRLADEERERQLERERRGREAAEAFLAVMSHELRTPITSIYGTATVLVRDPDRPDRRELLADVHEEAERLRRITDDLLVLSGVDRGLLRLSPEPMLVQHAIEEAVTDIRRRFPGIEIRVEIASPLPAVEADPTALRQVLHNLLSNAAKYAGADGPVTVRATAVEEAVEVAVLDEGPGPGADPEALFGLFYRAPHTSRSASGTGIGLYVAAELLRAMDATISAAQRQPRGAEFRFRLPLAGE
jgi:signal transduction histidine kinase